MRPCYRMGNNLPMPNSEEAWRFEHSVECDATAEFAWAFWSDVQNWHVDADVESIEMDGPFAAGTHGRTFSKTSGRIEWRVVEATPRKAIIEFPLPDAVG